MKMHDTAWWLDACPFLPDDRSHAGTNCHDITSRQRPSFTHKHSHSITHLDVRVHLSALQQRRHDDRKVGHKLLAQALAQASASLWTLMCVCVCVRTRWVRASQSTQAPARTCTGLWSRSSSAHCLLQHTVYPPPHTHTHTHTLAALAQHGHTNPYNACPLPPLHPTHIQPHTCSM